MFKKRLYLKVEILESLKGNKTSGKKDTQQIFKVCERERKEEEDRKTEREMIVRGERREEGVRVRERGNHKTPSSGKVLQANLPSFNECNSNVGIKVFILKLFASFISLEKIPQSR